MIISPFTPLFFDHFASDRLPSVYVQTFAKNDPVFVQCLCAVDEEPDFAISVCGEAESSWRPMSAQTYMVNDEVKLCFLRIKGLECGKFRLIERGTGLTSHPFIVTDDDSILRKTTLIQYSMDSNARRRDAVFMIDGMRRFFSFRVPGGFKDSDWTFAVDTEQFTASDGDIYTIYAQDSVQMKFTLGCAEGVPVHFAEMLNRILTCTYVYFDGIRFSRVGDSVPELTELSPEVDSFVFKINLQKVKSLDPIIERENYLSLRRDYESESYMTTDDINILTE